MLFTENYQKLVRACRNYNLLKLARLFWDSVLCVVDF